MRNFIPQPVFQIDSQSSSAEELIDACVSGLSRMFKRRAPRRAEPALLMLADIPACRPMPVLPAPSILIAETRPVARAKRRGKYGPSRSLYWILEIDGVAVNGKGGKARRFPTKAAALAYA